MKYANGAINRAIVLIADIYKNAELERDYNWHLRMTRACSIAKWTVEDIVLSSRFKENFQFSNLLELSDPESTQSTN